MTDPIREYLRSRAYASHVVEGGLEGLVRKWESTVTYVSSGKPQEQDDYLNDMDGRRILAEVLQICSPEEREAWMPRVEAADVKMRAHLVPTHQCIWGEENAVQHGYSRDHDWWYYHRPRNVEPDWRSY